MTAQALPAGRPAVERTIHVVQGDFAVVEGDGAVLTTVLGSCVAACVRDPVARVGGMNHFLLPGDEGEGVQAHRHGVHAMELLINALLTRGAARGRLEAKLFGGARMIQRLGDIGERNSRFARDFLQREGIPCAGASLGGEQARRIRYWPYTGRAQQLLVRGAQDEVFAREAARARPGPAPSGEVELF